MNLLFMGPQGAGKGTQSTKVANKYGLVHFSTGSIFRNEMKEQTELGKIAERYINDGHLVPDDVVINLVLNRVLTQKYENGFILDGFPRTLAQAEALERLMKELGLTLDAVINLEIDIDKAVQRISGRRVCRECGATYNLDHNPPVKPGVCDVCGGELFQRDDESAESVRQRLETYRTKTQPLIDFYASRQLLHAVNADRSIEDVFISIDEIVGGLSS